MIYCMQTVNIESTSSINSHAGNSTETLAPKKLLSALQDFANTGNTPTQIADFLNRWPEFLDKEKIERDAPLYLRDIMVRPFVPTDINSKPLPIEGADSPRYRMFKMLRDMLRAAWKGNDTMLAYLLSKSFNPEEGNYIVPDWRRSGFRYEPHTIFQAAVYELLKHSRQARVCANPDCPATYFLAVDHRQKFCSEDCTRPSQREWRRKWWEQHGKQWRKQRTKRTKSMKRRPRQ